MAEMTTDERGAFLHSPVRAEAFGRRNAVEGELLVRVTQAKTVAHKNISD